MSDEQKEEIKNIVSNFIHNGEYEEEQIEKKIENLIREKIQDIKNVNVYLVPFQHKIRVRIYLIIKKIHEQFKFRYEFEDEILINSKRKSRLKKILS